MGNWLIQGLLPGVTSGTSDCTHTHTHTPPPTQTHTHTGHYKELRVLDVAIGGMGYNHGPWRRSKRLPEYFPLDSLLESCVDLRHLHSLCIVNASAAPSPSYTNPDAELTFTEKGLSFISKMNSLRRLHLIECFGAQFVNCKGVNILKNLPQLQLLDLTCYPPMPVEFLHGMSEMLGLRVLNLTEARLTPDFINSLTTLTGLKQLILHDTTGMTDESIISLTCMVQQHACAHAYTQCTWKATHHHAATTQCTINVCTGLTSTVRCFRKMLRAQPIISYHRCFPLRQTRL
jgi:hypothetical protein